MCGSLLGLALGFRFRMTGYSHLFQMKGSAMPWSIHFLIDIEEVSNDQSHTNANEVGHSSHIIFYHLILKCHI